MQTTKKPEILAPAGNRDCMRAALAAGADVVYFGLDEGFNARARAANFPADQLGEIVQEIHRAGARAYVTLNTLVFQSELPSVERLLRVVAASQADALIVQDPAVALLARKLAPDVKLHASTQMTISSPEAARFAQTLGITRVILPRELSLQDIAVFQEGCSMETEVFIAGALCVSWSGQCLSSEAWGGRSANRGQCAQACRLPYDLNVDGQTRPLGNLAYLLSPQDLAGYRAIAALTQMGIQGLKIEGRQKDADYVFMATQAVHNWVHSEDPNQIQADLRDLSLTYSRGLGDGFLDGGNHQTLVDGRSPRHRGLLLGQVGQVSGRRIRVEMQTPPVPPTEEPPSPESLLSPHLPPAPLEPRPGMGLVVEELRQEDEVGGPIFGVVPTASGWWLEMGARGPHLGSVKVGSRVFLTSDPQVDRRIRQALSQPQPGRLGLHFKLRGSLHQPLEVEVVGPRGLQARVKSASNLQVAQKNPLDENLVRDKLGSLGGTCYCVESIDLRQLEGNLFMPVSQLKALRRELLEVLEACWEPAPPQTPEEAVWPTLLPQGRRAPVQQTPVRILPLCRTDEQLDAVIEAGMTEVILDWMELVGLRRAFSRARQAGLRVGVATVRVQKPLEEGYDRRLAALKPDLILVRHWAAVMELSGGSLPVTPSPAPPLPPRGRGTPEIQGDFSLNVTNAITALHLLELGLDSVTAAHDLDEAQLLDLLEVFPAEHLAVTVYQHIPTFYTEHCVYAHLLSQGRDYRTCGRPCEKHRVGLTDRKGITHPVVVDVGCRNTVFDGTSHNAARMVPDLIERGVRIFRLDFVWEDKVQTREILNAYRDLAH